MFTKPVIYMIAITLCVGAFIGFGIGYIVFDVGQPSTEKEIVRSKPKRVIVEKPVYIEKDSEKSTSTENTGHDEESTPDSDTVLVITEHDTVPADSSDIEIIKYDSITPEGIVVRKDQLVRNFTAEVEYLSDTGSVYASESDSVYMEHLDIRPEFETKAYEVEIWSSPLNYKGYRLGKKKLLLYGMEFVSGLELKYLDEELYLKAGSTYYKIEKSEDFIPYEEVKDPLVLKRLKT